MKTLIITCEAKVTEEVYQYIKKTNTIAVQDGEFTLASIGGKPITLIGAYFKEDRE